jgi:DNA-binding MarR family transcriptional regulator
MTSRQQLEGPIDPDDALWPVGRLLSAAARRVEREWDAYLATWGLSHASLPVLVHLARGPASQRELAARCDVAEQTMSRVLERVERLGLVTRRVHDDDHRRHVLELTAAGRDVCAAAADPVVATAMVTRGLTDDEAATLTLLLAKVARPDGDDVA